LMRQREYSRHPHPTRDGAGAVGGLHKTATI